jgi:hypothetical protein
MPRKQNENLKKGKATRFRTGEEQVKTARKGGIASGKARREKADLRKQIQLFFESEATTDKNGNPLTGAELMVKVAVKEMTKGNPKYWELLRDTGGFKPVDKVQLAEVDPEVMNEVNKLVEEAENEERENGSEKI